MLDKLARATESLYFVPTDEQRRVKAAWWSMMRETPLYSRDRFTAADVAEALSDPGMIEKWWSNPKFKSWFRNDKSIEQRFEYLLDLWTDAVVDIIRSDDPKSFTAKIALGKFLADMTNRTPASRKELKILDKDIASKTKEELQEFIKQSGIRKVS